MGGGVVGGEGGGEQRALLGGASTASGPGEPSACGARFPRGGTHLRPKKGVRLWVWGEDLEGGCLF